MQDGQNNFDGHRAKSVSGDFIHLATKIVAKVVAGESVTKPVVSEQIVQKLTEAVTASNPMAFEALKPELRRARISTAVLADVYIPEAARRLGVDWEDDRLSFADVTIGTVRLQSILRDISADWVADAGKTKDGLSGTVLLLLPDQEHHTLGALVLAGQLRRRGISVCLQIASADGDWKSKFSNRHFNGAIVSVGCESKLVVGEKLVASLKGMTNGKLPVAVGGAVLTRSDDIVTCEGADIVTNDLDKALTIFGLSAFASRALESA